MPLVEYELKLLNCSPEKSEGVFEKISNQFEDDLLEYNEFPEDYFNFVVRLLSEDKFYSRPGVWNFLLVLSTEQHKLAKEHYDQLSSLMIDHYGEYRDEDLCLAVCDFIARNYTFDSAKKIFDLLEKEEKGKPEAMHGFVDDGRRIMMAEKARSVADT